LDREFLILGEDFLGVIKDIVYREKLQNVNELRDGIVRAAKCVTKQMSVPGDKLTTLLMCVVPLTVPILRPTEHIRNFVRSSV
jgi:hypothetical protein